MKFALYKGRLKDNPKAKLFDRLICWWTRGPYSHAELVLEERDGASLCGSSSIRDGGVRTKWLRLDPARWTVIEVTRIQGLEHWTDDALMQRRTHIARGWFEQRQGAAYDWAAIFGFVFHRRWGRARKWFCSEAVCAALGMDGTGVSPNKLWLSTWGE